MDYRKMIIEMLDRVDETRLRHIYHFIIGLMD